MEGSRSPATAGGAPGRRRSRGGASRRAPGRGSPAASARHCWDARCSPRTAGLAWRVSAGSSTSSRRARAPLRSMTSSKTLSSSGYGVRGAGNRQRAVGAKRPSPGPRPRCLPTARGPAARGRAPGPRRARRPTLSPRCGLSGTRGRTGSDGRIRGLALEGLLPGVHGVSFEIAAYFSSAVLTGFYPDVTVTFTVSDERLALARLSVEDTPTVRRARVTLETASAEPPMGARRAPVVRTPTISPRRLGVSWTRAAGRRTR